MSEQTPSSGKPKGLNQDDFRKLLQTPRPGDAPAKGVLGGLSMRHRAAVPTTPKVGAAPFSKQEPFAPKPKKTRFRRNDSAEVTTGESKYRDRAAERRTGANPDYQETEQILQALNNSEKLEAKTIYEQSKYLGGDTEHTHLVKGLDYALLSKVRNELQKDTEDSTDEELEAIVAERPAEVEDTKPRINGRAAQSIYDVAIVEAQKKPARVNELFVAGRMAYIFELADAFGEYSDPFAIPTTVIRSKADIRNYGGIDKSTNDIVIDKISRVMAYVRNGGYPNEAAAAKDKKPKKKAKEKQPAEIKVTKPSVPMIDEDEDIFSDIEKTAADEVEEGPIFPAAAAINAEMMLAPGTGNTDANDDIAKDAMDIVEDKSVRDMSLKSLIQSAASTVADLKEVAVPGESDEAAKQSLPTKSESIRKRLYGEDGYEGDYSTFGLGLGMSGTRESAYDSAQSDSDSDVNVFEHTIRDQGVAKNKKAQLSRWDFDTEEEWKSYKDNVTAMPKSAFQFGVKTGDGRKTRRSGRELTEKQKLDRDWQKISRIMEQKYGQGEEGSAKKKQKKT